MALARSKELQSTFFFVVERQCFQIGLVGRSWQWLRSLSGWETVEVLLLVEVAPGQACGEVSVMAEVAPRPACRGGLGDDGPDRSWAEL